MNCCNSQTNLVSFRGSQQPASVMCARYSIVRKGTQCAVFANTVRTATICCYHKKLLIHAIISVRTVVVLCRTLILSGLQQQHTVLILCELQQLQKYCADCNNSILS